MTTPVQETIETEVVIIGAGPAGLMIANLLGLYGRKVVLLEGRKELIDYPRAVGMDDETLRLVQTIGLSEQVIPLTGPSHIMRLVNGRGGVILYNDPQVHPFGWPRKNGFNQPLMDAELLKGLDRFDNVQVCFDHYVEGVDEDADGVTVQVAVGGWTGAEALGSSPDEAGVGTGAVTARKTIRAQYLVGCEGGKSATRKRMGVSFDGMSNSTRWLVVDIEHDPLGTPNVWLGADPERSYVSIGLPQGVRRFEFRLRDDEPDEVVTDPAWVNEILKDHVPDTSKLSFIRRRVYTHHGRVASSFRTGRQLIAGDAAHLMPVWLGQGYNSVGRDAMNVSWKLATILAGQARPDLLDTYTEERMDHAKAMVRLSVLMGDLIKLRHPIGVPIRDGLAAVAMRIPRLRSYFGELRFRPAPKYERGAIVDQSTLTPGRAERRLTARSMPFRQTALKDSTVGVQFPQSRVNTKDHTGALLDDVCGPWWTVLCWMNDPHDILNEDSLATLRAMGARLVTVLPENQRGLAEKTFHDDVVVVGDANGTLKKWFDTKPVGVVFLRPDHFIGAACLAGDADRALDAITTAISWTGEQVPGTTSGEPATALQSA